MTFAIVIRILVSVLTGIFTGFLGIILLMPAIMAWDSGSPTLPMRLLSYLSLSVTPVAVISALLSCIFGYAFLLLNLLPIAGILLLFTFIWITGK